MKLAHTPRRRFFWQRLYLPVLLCMPLALQANDLDTAGDSQQNHNGVPRWQHGLSYFGPFKYPPGFKHFDYVNPDAPKGGRIVRAIGYSFNSFTPYIDKGIGIPGLDVIGEPMLYDSLMRPSADEVGVYYGYLAERMRIEDGGTKLRVQLHPQARWHDGVPVTARDLKFTFEHIRDHAFAFNAAYTSLKQVDVISEREVLFTYHYPVNVNAMTALGKVAILPEHYWRERDISETTTEPPLTGGPYRVGDFKLGQYIELERVEDHWGRDLGPWRGRNNLDVLRFELYRDATVQREAVRKGLLDMFYEPSVAQWITGYDRSGSSAGLLLQERHAASGYMGVVSAIGFNQSVERFQDVRVREALSLAFNFEWMNDVLDYGAFTRPFSYFPDTFMEATGLPSAAELELLEPLRDQLPARVFTEPPWGQAHEPLSTRAALARAQELLAEAGWLHRDGQLVNASDEPFELEFLTTGEPRRLLPYVEQLKRLGIDARIRRVESAQYITLRRNGKGDAVFGALAISMPPNQEVPAYLGSTSRGMANFTNLGSPMIDTLIEHLLGASNRADLMAAGRALDRVLYWQFYVVPARMLEPTRVMVWDKFGKPDAQARGGAGLIDTWWWDKKKAARVEQALTPR